MMVTYPHALTECDECGAHYCMGCAGEECPNCKSQETAFYAIELEKKLEAVKSWVKYELVEYDKRRLHFSAYKLERDRHDRLIQLDKILEAS